jgi:DNA-binding response OmpR family regulator
MMNESFAAERGVATRTLRTAVVVTRPPLRSGFETALRDAGYTLVVIRSLAHAYEQIKRVAPDLIVLNLSRNDDAAGCQLLSMLSLDSDMSGVPLLTLLSKAAEYLHEGASEPDEFSHAGVGFVH